MCKFWCTLTPLNFVEFQVTEGTALQFKPFQDAKVVAAGNEDGTGKNKKLQVNYFWWNKESERSILSMATGCTGLVVVVGWLFSTIRLDKTNGKENRRQIPDEVCWGRRLEKICKDGRTTTTKDKDKMGLNVKSSDQIYGTAIWTLNF